MLDSFMRLVEVLMLLSCWESVSSQDSAVQGFLRRDVVLPCSYNKTSLEDVNVHWRDGGNNVLLDIIKGMEVLKSQNQKYKGRVSSFPEEYIRGNFSILIKNLQQQDAKIYECFIPAKGITRPDYIRLQVSEAPTEPPTESPSPRSPGPPTGPNLLAVWVGVGVVLLLLLLLLLVLVLLFIRRRSRRSSSI